MNTRTFHHEACALLVYCNHSPNVSTNKCSCVIRTSIGFFRTQNHKMAERISDQKFLDADPFEVKLRDKFFGGVRNIKNSRDTISSALKQKLEIGTWNEWPTVKGLQNSILFMFVLLVGVTLQYKLQFALRQLPVSVNLLSLHCCGKMTWNRCTWDWTKKSTTHYILPILSQLTCMTTGKNFQYKIKVAVCKWWLLNSRPKRF